MFLIADTNEDEVNESGDNFTIKDIVDSTESKVVQLSDNGYMITMNNNTNLTAYRFAVYDLESFKNVTEYISANKIPYDMILIDFKENLTLNIDYDADAYIKTDFNENIVIRGNGATIISNNKHHFLKANTNATIWMSNITIKKFNCPVVNQGKCQFNNVNFEENVNPSGNGGAINNKGILKCVDCSFIKNSANSGGAIYNDLGSQSSIITCSFKDNKADKKCEKSGFSNNDENNIHSSTGASCIVLNAEDDIVFFNIRDMTDYNTYFKIIPILGHVKYLILNFTPNTYNIYKYDDCVNLKDVENLFIEGNGATIKV